MSKHGGPFPTKDAEFSNYIILAIAYLVTHQVRLSVSDTNKDALLALLGDTGTAGTWLDVFPKSQTRATRTGTVIDDKNDLRDQIEDLLRAVYDDIPKSALTNDDRNTLNLKKRDSEPSKRPQITTTPYARMFPVKGGKIKITVRVAGDSTRSSMHPDADSIEMRFSIGTTAPVSVKDTTDKKVYKGSVRTFGFGQENATKRLYGFFRWKNETDEAKSGPWSELVQTVIA